MNTFADCYTIPRKLQLAVVNIKFNGDQLGEWSAVNFQEWLAKIDDDTILGIEVVASNNNAGWNIIDLINTALFSNLKYVGGKKANNEQAVFRWTSNKTIHYNNGALFVIELELLSVNYFYLCMCLKKFRG